MALLSEILDQHRNAKIRLLATLPTSNDPDTWNDSPELSEDTIDAGFSRSLNSAYDAMQFVASFQVPGLKYVRGPIYFGVQIGSQGIAVGELLSVSGESLVGVSPGESLTIVVNFQRQFPV